MLSTSKPRARRGVARRCPRPARALLKLLCAGAVLAPGCVIRPEGTDEQKRLAAHAGAPYEPAVEDRQVPDLPERPGWQDVLRRSFLANGELEGAYFRWKAAIERIDIAGAYPNTDVNVGYSYAFSSERMNAFDRSTFTIGFDAMENLAFPGKTEQAAKVALAEARTAGAAFREKKFDLQRRVLFAWSDYKRAAALLDLQREEVTLRRALSGNAAARAITGQRRRDALEAELELAMAESELADMASEQGMLRARLNTLMERDPGAPLPVPEGPEPHRPIPADDLALLAAAAEMFPEVAVLTEEVGVRREALELARLRWIPDINPSFMFTGSIMQAVGAMFVLPTTIGEIQGSIREAQAQLRGAEAMFRQRRIDRIGEYVGLLVAMRNAQRREQLFRASILPAARRLAEDQTRAYEAGAATLADVIEARRTLLAAERTIAESLAQIERAIVEIECCLGVDIETVAPAPDKVASAAGHAHRTPEVEP